MRLRVNPITCEAHGMCVELLPELIRRDDWGYPIIDHAEVPPELESLARRRRTRARRWRCCSKRTSVVTRDISSVDRRHGVGTAPALMRVLRESS